MYKMKNDGWIHDIAKALCCIFLIMTSGGMLYSCSSENEDPVPPGKVRKMTKRKNTPMCIS